KHILRVTGVKPQRICYYVASNWKWEAYLEALSKGRQSARETIKTFMAKPELRSLGKQASKILVRIVEGASRIDEEVRRRRLKVGKLDEEGFLREAKGFLEKEFEAKVEVFREDMPEVYDPKGRASLAEPYRPAIYVE
ncbi:MAG: leucine--tRNA ligase, partial [Candidatus Hecatellaceae archaeon]